MIHQRPTSPHRYLLPALLALLVACDCESLLAKKRGNAPVYRVDAPATSERGLQIPDTSSRARSQRTPPVPTKDSSAASNPGTIASAPQPGATDDLLARYRNDTDPRVWARARDTEDTESAQRGPDQDDSSAYDDESEMDLRPQWDGRRLNPFFQRSNVVGQQLHQMRGRVLIPPSGDHPGFVETPMPDEPPMDLVPGNFPDE